MGLISRMCYKNSFAVISIELSITKAGAPAFGKAHHLEGVLSVTTAYRAALSSNLPRTSPALHRKFTREHRTSRAP